MHQIRTLEQLYAAKTANLGPMTQGTYASFMDQAKKLGVANPLLVIDIKINSSFQGQSDLREGPDPVGEEDWRHYVWYFQNEPHMNEVEFIPQVYVLDGNQFTVPRM